jgi:transposase
VKQVERDEEPGVLDADERAELERLRKEVKELRMDREILRKAASYFARETNR